MAETIVACVKWGSMYGAEYVNILHDMVRRNLSNNVPGKFVCFTDDPSGLDDGIEVRFLPEGLGGWWNKIFLFSDAAFDKGDRVVYFDLDTVITGSLDDIVRYGGEFAILRDFYRPLGFGSGVMAWEAGKHDYLWEEFKTEGCPVLPGGDQEWIENKLRIKPDLLQSIYPQAFASYKVSCREMFPKHCKVVCFHGEPKPHNAGGWVNNIWKIGGGSAFDLEHIGNTSQDDVIANVEHSASLKLPQLSMQQAHESHAVIVGGAPSLNDLLPGIKLRAEYNQKIFATNNTWRKLEFEGIIADFHVMLDARKENADFVPKSRCYYASQCNPAIFERAKENPVTVWHTVECIDIAPKNAVLVGGGSTVGLKTMCLAYILGYRNIHLYGMDSCYRDDKHHAYPQALNDNERVIDVICEGKSYKCAPWMVQQVEEFKELASQLVALGCTITVHGEGLLQDVAKAISV
jgi:uncharacterized Rossmann fold enzyme